MGSLRAEAISESSAERERGKIERWHKDTPAACLSSFIPFKDLYVHLSPLKFFFIMKENLKVVLAQRAGMASG